MRIMVPGRRASRPCHRPAGGVIRSDHRRPDEPTPRCNRPPCSTATTRPSSRSPPGTATARTTASAPWRSTTRCVTASATTRTASTCRPPACGPAPCWPRASVGACRRQPCWRPPAVRSASRPASGSPTCATTCPPSACAQVMQTDVFYWHGYAELLHRRRLAQGHARVQPRTVRTLRPAAARVRRARRLALPPVRPAGPPPHGVPRPARRVRRRAARTDDRRLRPPVPALGAGHAEMAGADFPADVERERGR